MYRAEFAYPDLDCDVQRAVYSFDWTNTPALNTSLLAGGMIQRIPLVLDTDAPFLLRGLEIPFSNPTNDVNELQYRLEDCKDNPLSDCDNSVTTANFQWPSLSVATGGAGITAIDSDSWGIYCPAGGRFNLYVYNPTALTLSLLGVVVNLHGVKLYSGKVCA